MRWHQLLVKTACIPLLRLSHGFAFPHQPTFGRSYLPWRLHRVLQQTTLAGHAENNKQELKVAANKSGSKRGENDTTCTTATPSASSDKDEKQTAPPLCKCNQPACQRTVKKEGPNQGRKFWGCAEWPKKNGCQFFQWDAPAACIGDDPNSASGSSTSPQGLALKIVTLNVAQFCPHSLAPRGFDPQQFFLEELERLRPDVLALQELPNPHTTFDGYQRLGCVSSHCGYVGLFFRQEFLQDNLYQPARLVFSSPENNRFEKTAEQLPVVLGSIHLKNGKQIVIGSCHLEPFKEGSEVRLAQLETISKATKNAEAMILAGDMNMRQSEDEQCESLTNFKDAWKEAGGIRREAYTWDSRINHYHGTDSFQFCCRFDRVYSRNAQGVDTFRLIVNEPLNDSNDSDGHYYLSDHFGIVTTVLV